MGEDQTVELNLSLPKDVAERALELQTSDPELLSRIVLYGLTRRAIYRHLREIGHGA